MAEDGPGADRRTRLAGARLYLVSAVPGDPPDPSGLPDLVRAAVAGGVDVFQLREKRLPDDELTAVADALRALCERIGALLIVNDRPTVAVEAGADGVHVGQEDLPVDEVRQIVGPEMLIGLSTHSEAEIDAVDPAAVAHMGVGAVDETRTKEGRAPRSVELGRSAGANARVPFFAIGGLNAGNIGEVTAAGAERAVVLRAIAAAADPEAAARELRAALGADR